MQGMDVHDATQALQQADVIPLAQGPIPYIKELVKKCLEADIPAAAGHPPGQGKG
ncbi:MAG: hypothetical protein MJE77_04660 [Proteobacteria bacterium]|nr:hypothetical protein [Pseudomonadota bacterium]